MVTLLVEPVGCVGARAAEGAASRPSAGEASRGSGQRGEAHLAGSERSSTWLRATALSPFRLSSTPTLPQRHEVESDAGSPQRNEFPR